MQKSFFLFLCDSLHCAHLGCCKFLFGCWDSYKGYLISIFLLSLYVYEEVNAYSILLYSLVNLLAIILFIRYIYSPESKWDNLFSFLSCISSHYTQDFFLPEKGIKDSFQKVILGRYGSYDLEDLYLRKDWKIVGEYKGQKECYNKH